MERLILASSSPRRRELLSLLGVPFTVVATSVDEGPGAIRSPAETASLSLAKARAAAESHRGGLIVAADTVVVYLASCLPVSAQRAQAQGGETTCNRGEVMGKPADPAEAASMLQRLRGRKHRVFSGLAVLDPRSQEGITQLVETVIWMRNYSDDEIARYVASGEPMDKAGAYAIQDRDFRPVERIEGCYASVMGLPLCHLYLALRQMGLALNETSPRKVLKGCMKVGRMQYSASKRGEVSFSEAPDRACQAFIGHECPVADAILSHSVLK